MAIDNFLISWWYSPNTKLAFNFTTAGASAFSGLSYLNGLSSSIDENYHFENQITNHPVEGLTSITDNIIIQPKIITITGLLSSITTIPLVGEIGPSILNFNTLGRATQILANMVESKQLLSLTTGLYFGSSIFRINNVVIQSLDIPRDYMYGRTTLKFTVVFREVIVTNTDATSRAQVNSKSASGSLDPNIVGVT